MRRSVVALSSRLASSFKPCTSTLSTSSLNVVLGSTVSSKRNLFITTVFLRGPPPMDLIKQLRVETDAPLGQCRKALEESGNDISKAKEWLRQKGLQTAAKKSSRTTQEGVIGMQQLGNERSVLLEVNSETDFVLNSDKFKEVIDECLDQLVKFKPSQNELSVEQNEQAFESEIVSNSAIFGGSSSIKEKFNELVAILRENVKPRRVKYLVNTNTIEQQLAGYLHNSKGEKIGGVASFVIVKAVPGSNKTPEQLQSLGRQIAMHICGMGPNYLTKEQVPAEVVQHERDLLLKRLEEQQAEEKQKAEQEGKEYKPKSQDILNKMIDGQLNKQFLSDQVLLLQPWVLDQKMTVQQFCKDSGIEIIDFVRMKVGEGMQYKPKKSFAEEVAEQVKV
ncbi:hypothetical protein FDP41_004115 [Naegleria fowleri]|uniref:Elongation factor Ts, mitochondrial n=1 Tax=Naegleria fowleri TaxID=5763 RepID=A0A6A5BSP4_NAEFO|nr:uncharacterized protein FDP41_004115 [Naegleria fowleri]KAF0976820.1 hypothetical protein FDP41_004115 [Naegleria fowleri]